MLGRNILSRIRPRKNKLIGSDIQSLTAMRGSALPPQQHRLLQFSKNLYAKLKKVEITVIEIQ